jgi:survival-of-motor-neuron-related-splicing factor 30
MNKEALETYQVQLQQVEAALASDPDNDGLKDLHRELKELISLTEQALAQQVTAASSSATGSSSKKQNAQSTLTPQWKAGDECLAKYSSDGQWYPARIASIGGSVENRVYTIVFKTYNTTELVSSSLIKTLPANHQASNNPYLSSAGTKRKLTKVEEEDRERKKKKNEKKLEVRAQKAKEQNEKQATWKKFAKKSEKKGIHIAGVAGTSIFKTPDNPLGKGVFRSLCCWVSCGGVSDVFSSLQSVSPVVEKA